MSRPNDKGNVNQFEGKRYVSAGSRNEPGVCGLMKPSMNTIRTTVRILTEVLSIKTGFELTAKTREYPQNTSETQQT